KLDEHYLEANYDIKYDSLDFLEEDATVISGSYADLDSLANFIFSQDMNVTSNYEQVKSKLDVESYADYFITELFYNNLDWPHNNLKIWRDRLYHPKWRYLLFDLDGAFTYHGWVP